MGDINRAHPQHTFTIAQFCASHNISRTQLYLLQQAGCGPSLIRIGRRVLISAEAAADWRHMMQRASAETCRPTEQRTTWMPVRTSASVAQTSAVLEAGELKLPSGISRRMSGS